MMFPQKQHNIYGQNSFNSSNSDLSKSYRRQWNKSNNELNFEYQDQDINNEYQKRYDDYLLNLQINNQIIKLANKKDKNVEKLEKLELGFNTYVNGAHKQAEKYTPRYTTATSSASSDKKNSFCMRPRLHVRKSPLDNLRGLELLANQQQQKTREIKSAPVQKINRKKWANASFTIKTSDGYEIKINAPESMRKNPVSQKQKTHTTTPRPKLSTKKDMSKNKSKLDKFSGSNDCEYYYSDDFESDDSNISENIEENDVDGSEIEDEVVEKDTKLNDNNQELETIKFTNINPNEQTQQELIQSVRFSDESDNEEINITKVKGKMPDHIKNDPKKKFSFKLSTSDVKLLRQSINELNLSEIRNSRNYENQNKLDIVDSDLEYLDLNESKDGSNRNSTPSQSITIDCENFNKKRGNESSNQIVDLLIKNVSNLTARDRNNLLKFLSNVDDKDENNQFLTAGKN